MYFEVALFDTSHIDVFSRLLIRSAPESNEQAWINFFFLTLYSQSLSWEASSTHLASPHSIIYTPCQSTQNTKEHIGCWYGWNYTLDGTSPLHVPSFIYSVQCNIIRQYCLSLNTIKRAQYDHLFAIKYLTYHKFPCACTLYAYTHQYTTHLLGLVHE